VFSRLAPWKGQSVALDALARIRNASCVIAGDALFGEEEYARALQSQAERLGIVDRVLFLGHRDDVAALMQAVDVVVHPSIDPEPFGLTLVEAMFAETPVIASQAGAAGEILDGGLAGTLVPPGDPSALAAAVERCRSQPESIARQVAAGRRRAERHFSAGRLQRDIRRVVAELVRDARPASKRDRSRLPANSVLAHVHGGTSISTACAGSDVRS
jgi:glycosyltransferase involved in cell wall biosynthesis